MGDWGRGKEADAESGRGELLTFVILQSSFIGLQVPSCIASHAKVNLSLLLGFSAFLHFRSRLPRFILDL